MSVYHQSLVLYGWEIGTDQYKEYDEEDGWGNELEQEYGWRDQSEGDVAVVYDGRGGRYCYFGVVMAASNSTRDGRAQDIGRINIDEQSPDGPTMMRLGNIQERFDIDVDGGPQTHIFTHIT